MNVESLNWQKSRFFPFFKTSKKPYKHIAVIGIGGNVGDVKKRFDRVFRYFLNNALLHVKETSPILKNPPFGFLEQDDFLNAIMVIQTSLNPSTLLNFLQHTEKIFKRERSFKNAPRSLDLDIIFFDSMKIKQDRVIIPHPKWNERESVILPLLTLKGKI
ncbi:MAG: 2-amino-4-hydroxy-6-hydroxymethyldihydropteridine diphosphokinase [Campylobacteraceae bacterium]|jgi:2-amino-4-hydroxy-6-hydroxymethyldihydropteridine diphosphokinase|nr:2-amino-4-hydroxy-6-hydroxymethyldihydropteridine diphosphokinase [Campylobacteraceae bacterium]